MPLGVCLGGYLNVVIFPKERGRGGGLSPTMRRFLEIMEELELRICHYRGTLHLEWAFE